MGEISKLGASLKEFKVKWKNWKISHSLCKKGFDPWKNNAFNKKYSSSWVWCVEIKTPKMDQKPAHYFFVQSSRIDYREILQGFLFYKHWKQCQVLKNNNTFNKKFLNSSVWSVQIKTPQRNQKPVHCFFVQSPCIDYSEILQDFLFSQYWK